MFLETSETSTFLNISNNIFTESAEGCSVLRTPAINVSKAIASPYDENFISERIFNEIIRVTNVLSVVVWLLAVPACILNVLANSLRRRDAYIFYLVGVSIGDGMDLLCQAPNLLVRIFQPSTSYAFIFTAFYLGMFASAICRRAAIVLNALASAERFLTLAFPFTVSRNFLNASPRLAVTSVFVCLCLLHISLLFEYNVTNVKYDTWMLLPSTHKEKYHEQFVSVRIVARTAGVYAPLLVSLIVNLVLISAFRVHSALQRDIRATSGKSLESKSRNTGRHLQTRVVAKTCRLVLALSFSFVFLALPRVVNETVSSFLDGYTYFSRGHYLVGAVNAVADLTPYLTEPTLFLVSFAVSRQFRKNTSTQLKRICFKT